MGETKTQGKEQAKPGASSPGEPAGRLRRRPASHLLTLTRSGLRCAPSPMHAPRLENQGSASNSVTTNDHTGSSPQPLLRLAPLAWLPEVASFKTAPCVLVPEPPQATPVSSNL